MHRGAECAANAADLAGRLGRQPANPFNTIGLRRALRKAPAYRPAGRLGARPGRGPSDRLARAAAAAAVQPAAHPRPARASVWTRGRMLCGHTVRTFYAGSSLLTEAVSEAITCTGTVPHCHRARCLAGWPVARQSAARASASGLGSMHYKRPGRWPHHAASNSTQSRRSGHTPAHQQMQLL